MFHGNRIIALIGLVLTMAVTQPALAKPKVRGRGMQTRTTQAKAAEVAAEPTPEVAEVPPADASPAQPEAPDAAPVTPPSAASEPTTTDAASVQEQLPAAASTAPDAAPVPSVNEANEATAALRAEVTTLMDDLATARAKAAVLGKTLFKTRIVVRVQNLAGSDLRMGRLLVSLDGAPVFRGDGSALTGDEARQVFEGFAAPGPHVLTLECEQRMRDDDAYGYTLRESYRVKVPRDRETDLLLVLDDDSSDAEDLAEDGEGEYDVRTRLRQTTRELKAR